MPNPMGTASLEVEVVAVRAFWNPHPLRHPVQRWKTRAIRRAFRAEAKRRVAMNPAARELLRRIEEAEERALLFGEPDA